MNKIKDLITFKIKKSILSLIILSILCIINYCYDEYSSLELKHQFISPVYSSVCPPGALESLPSPPKIPSLPIKEFLVPGELPLKIPQKGNTALLDITISSSSPKIDHCRSSQKYETNPPGGKITLDINPRKLNENPPPYDGPGGVLDLKTTPMKSFIDRDSDDILDSLDLDTEDDGKKNGVTSCSPLSENPKHIICTRGKTDLLIDQGKQNIILGASTKDSGIIVIADDTGKKPLPPEKPLPQDMAIIKACKEQITYKLPRSSVIEIVCTR